jgi:hypothetical protein
MFFMIFLLYFLVFSTISVRRSIRIISYLFFCKGGSWYRENVNSVQLYRWFCYCFSRLVRLCSNIILILLFNLLYGCDGYVEDAYVIIFWIIILILLSLWIIIDLLGRWRLFMGWIKVGGFCLLLLIFLWRIIFREVGLFVEVRLFGELVILVYLCRLSYFFM